MKIPRNFVLKVILAIIWSLSKAENKRSDDSPEISSTISTLYLTGTSIENVTNNPLDNGMVIKDIRDKNEVYNLNLEESIKELDVKPSTVSVIFPSDHPKIISQQSSQFFDYGGIRSPLNHRNKYQEPYKVHEEPNNMKPMKFEENSLKTLFIPSSYDKGPKNEIKFDQTQFVVKPFPYAFEGSYVGHNWHGNDQNLNLDSHNEGFDSTYQENGIPYAYYTYGSQDYNTGIHHHEHHWSDVVPKDSNQSTTWKKIAQIVTALVPFGLLLATLTPSIFTIDATNPPPTRLRSEDPAKSKFKQSILNLLKANGVDSFNSTQCEDKALCDLARKGIHPLANTIERGIWLLANKTPAEVAEKAGMNQLFHAVRTNNCDIFECDSPEKLEGRAKIIKKIIRKKKLLNPVSHSSIP